MTTEQRIAEIREREQKATAGPWIMGIDAEDGNGTAERVMSIDCGNGGTPVLGEVYNPEQIDEDNAIFIAHARSDIPFLLKQFDTLAAECLRLREDKKRLDWLETGESKDDLNACHEFWQSMSDEDQERFCKELHSVSCPEDCRGLPWHCSYVINATARQRCEAFLRVHGLWKDNPTPERSESK